MSIWQPTDARRLRQLRLAQGVDTFALAHRCAISERQLLELEGDGEGGFYSEAIKYQTGLKLLRFLGDDAVDLQRQVSATRSPHGKAQTVTQPLQVAPPAENSKLLHHIGLVLVLSGLLISVVNVMDGLGPRPGGVLLTVVGVGVLLLVQLGKNGWAVLLLCWGLLLLTFASAWSIRGLANVAWVAPPIAIMAAGWFIGRRLAWIMAGVSGLGALSLYAMHLQKHPFAVDVPLETFLAALMVSFAVSAFIGGAISQTYGRQFELISESRAELHSVMDSTPAMIWSVSAQDFSLRTFNRVCEMTVFEKSGVTLGLGMTPEQMFNQPGVAAQWVSAYTKAREAGQGWSWEEDLFMDGRTFEISCQPIRRAQSIIGLSIYAQEGVDRRKAPLAPNSEANKG